MLKCFFPYSVRNTDSYHFNWSPGKQYKNNLKQHSRYRNYLKKDFASFWIALSSVSFSFFLSFPHRLLRWIRNFVKKCNKISFSYFASCVPRTLIFFSFTKLFEYPVFCTVRVRFYGVGDAFTMFFYLPQNWENLMITWNSTSEFLSSSRGEYQNRGRTGLETRLWMFG